MSNTSINLTSPQPQSAQLHELILHEPKKKSLGSRVLSAFILGVKALFLSASAASGVALMSIGGTVFLPVGATLLGCSAFFGFLLVKRQIDKRGAKLERQIKAHAELISMQEKVSRINARSLGKLNHEVRLVAQANKELEETCEKLNIVADSLGKFSEEMWAMLTEFKETFISMSNIIERAIRLDSSKAETSKVVRRK
ncbi:MAG: hypothetical protein ACRC6D_09505 [Aeromonas sp.]